MKTVRLFCFVLTAAALAGASVAQEAPKPGPEHAQLKKMEGTWDATVDMGGQKSKAVAVYKMDLGGLWMTSTFEGEMMGGKFQGRGLDSYDQVKKKFVGVWVDNWTTLPMVMEGSYDPAKKMTTMVGEARGPDGQMAKHTITTTMVDDNTINFAMYHGDMKEAMLKIEYKRRK